MIVGVAQCLIITQRAECQTKHRKDTTNRLKVAQNVVNVTQSQLTVAQNARIVTQSQLTFAQSVVIAAQSQRTAAQSVLIAAQKMIKPKTSAPPVKNRRNAC